MHNEAAPLTVEEVNTYMKTCQSADSIYDADTERGIHSKDNDAITSLDTTRYNLTIQADKTPIQSSPLLFQDKQ